MIGQAGSALIDRLALRSARPLNPVSRALTWPLLALIRLYQWTLSPLLGPVCRYHPSCSRYGFGSIRDHGPLLGSWLTGRRILRCNPWARGGVDPVVPRGAGWATLVWRARSPEGLSDEPDRLTPDPPSGPAVRSDPHDPHDPHDPAPSRSAAA